MSADPLGTLSRSVTEVLASGLTGLDLVLLAAAALIALGGLRTGLLARAAAWAGLIAGLALSGSTVPAALAVAEGAGLRARTFLAVLTHHRHGVDLLHRTPGRDRSDPATAHARPTVRARPGPRRRRQRRRVHPAARGLLIPTAAAVPGRVSSEVRASSVLGTLDAATPPQPDVGRALRTLLGGERFPDVFATLAPTPEPSTPPTTIGIAPEVLARAITASTSVRVVGCGRSYSGSGFADRPGAHRHERARRRRSTRAPPADARWPTGGCRGGRVR